MLIALLTGCIIDEEEACDSMLIGSVNVTIEGPESPTVTYTHDGATADCDAAGDGTFVCGWEAAGQITVHAEAEGWLDAEETVTITEGRCHVEPRTVMMVMEEDGVDCTEGMTGELCTAAGETRCGDAEDGSGPIETCTEDADGCLGWVATDSCAGPTWCEDAAGAAECTCDLCSVDGDSRCNGTSIEICTEGVDGCLGWVQWEDCAGACAPSSTYPEEGNEVECIACDRGIWEGDAWEVYPLFGYTAVHGSVTLEGGEASSLVGLGCLQEVTGGLKMGPTVWDPQWMMINRPCGLISLSGLEGLTSIGGGLSIGGCSALTNLDGLRNLDRIGGSLAIYGFWAECAAGHVTFPCFWGNDALTSLRGLEALTTIGGDLYIDENVALTNLRGLAALSDLGANLSVTDNTALPTCEATDLVDQLVALGWDGVSTIHGNDDEGACE